MPSDKERSPDFESLSKAVGHVITTGETVTLCGQGQPVTGKLCAKAPGHTGPHSWDDKERSRAEELTKREIERIKDDCARCISALSEGVNPRATRAYRDTSDIPTVHRISILCDMALALLNTPQASKFDTLMQQQLDQVREENMKLRARLEDMSRHLDNEIENANEYGRRAEAAEALLTTPRQAEQQREGLVEKLKNRAKAIEDLDEIAVQIGVFPMRAMMIDARLHREAAAALTPPAPQG